MTGIPSQNKIFPIPELEDMTSLYRFHTGNQYENPKGGVEIIGKCAWL
jgi:hypothetical protein